MNQLQSQHVVAQFGHEVLRGEDDVVTKSQCELAWISLSALGVQIVKRFVQRLDPHLVILQTFLELCEFLAQFLAQAAEILEIKDRFVDLRDAQ